MEKLIQFCNVAICSLFALIFAGLILPNLKPFPFTDDWIYVDALGKSFRELIRWALVPYNDHFMPLVKVAQFFTLCLTGFDYRPLIALNFAIGLIGALCYFEVARRFRQRVAFGDLVIPLIILNIGFNVYAWGFAAPYGISVAGSAGFLVAFGHAAERRSFPFLIGAFVFLTICVAMSADNGLIVAAVTSTMILCGTFAVEPTSVAKAVRWLSLVEVLICVIIILHLRSNPSIPILIASPARLGDWAYQLSKSSFALTASAGGLWKSAIILTLTASACALTLADIKKRARSGLQLFDIAVYASLCGYLVLPVMITVGRAGMFEWQGLEGHYGYLMGPITIFAWIILSRFSPKYVASLIGIALIVTYGRSFAFGFEWRWNYARETFSRSQQITYLIGSESIAAEDIVSKYMLDLYYID